MGRVMGAGRRTNSDLEGRRCGACGGGGGGVVVVVPLLSPPPRGTSLSITWS